MLTEERNRTIARLARKGVRVDDLSARFELSPSRIEIIMRSEGIDTQSDDCVRLKVDRDPCIACQVPKDRHAEHGCKTYRRAA